MKYNFLDLFSGIGGFRLGAEWAELKFDKEYHSDIDEYANKVYAKHFSDSIQLGDIMEVDFEKLKDGNEWLICGGFPCQDISIAGKGAGIGGSRSGLWFEMFRAIRILQPRFAIIENVSAITFRGLDTVLITLAEIGYDAEWQNIRASDMGAPHRRERIWIVAYPRLSEPQRRDDLKEGLQHRGRGSSWSESSSCGNAADTERKKSGEQTERKGREDISGESEKISNAGSKGLSESAQRQFRSIQKQDESFQGREHSRASTAGKPGDRWSVEPDVCRMDDGIFEELDGGINGNINEKTLETKECCKKAQEKSMRELWATEESMFTPQGWEWFQQRGRQFDDVMRVLSYDIASRKGRSRNESTKVAMLYLWETIIQAWTMQYSFDEIKEAWASLSCEEKDWTVMAANKSPWVEEWFGVGRLATGIPNRVHRLKCLGNSIVPAIAKLLFNLIKEHLNDEIRIAK